jgi:hypothetical protein
MWGRGWGEGVVPPERCLKQRTRGGTPSPLPSPPKGARGTGDLAMLSEAGLGVALTALLYLQGYSRAQFVG